MITEQHKSTSNSSIQRRVVLCSYSSVYTDCVLRRISDERGISIVGLVDSARVFKKNQNTIPAAISLIRNSGFLYSGYLAVITTPALRLPHMPKWKSMSTWAKELNCPIIEPPDINALETRQAISRLKPDILLSAHFNQILSSVFLKEASFDCLNIHPGPLPTHRGIDPAFFGLLQKDRGLGVSLHVISEEIDQGEVVAQYRMKPLQRSLFRTNLELFTKGADLFCSHVKKRTDRPLNLHCGPENYNSWPTRSEVWQYLKSGARF